MSCTEGQFSGVFFSFLFKDIFLEASGICIYVVSRGACFLFTNALCSEDQFVSTLF